MSFVAFAGQRLALLFLKFYNRLQGSSSALSPGTWSTTGTAANPAP